MTIREALTKQFGLPIQQMSFPEYFAYLNSAGKISQRSLLELFMVLCEIAEAQEKTMKGFEDNFFNIEAILTGLTAPKPQPQPAPVKEEIKKPQVKK